MRFQASQPGTKDDLNWRVLVLQRIVELYKQLVWWKRPETRVTRPNTLRIFQQNFDFRPFVEEFFAFAEKNNIQHSFELEFVDTEFENIKLMERSSGKKVVDNGWFDLNITARNEGAGHVCFMWNRRDFRRAGGSTIYGTQPHPNLGVWEYVVYAEDKPRHGMSQPVYTLWHEIAHAWAERLDKIDHYMAGGKHRWVLHDYVEQGRFVEFFTEYLGVAKETPMPWDDEKLINAIIQVESGGDDNAIGDRNLRDKAYGPLQIRAPYVKDVNARFGTNHRAQDCLGNRVLSIWIFKRYMEIYAGPNATREKMARQHNGGPSGHTRRSTIPYWEKVRALL